MRGGGKSTRPSRRVDRYSVLLSVGGLLGKEVELDGLLKKILDKVIKVVDAERATIYFVDPVKGEIFSRAAHLPELMEIRMKIGQGAAGYVARTGTIVKLPDPAFDRLHSREIDTRTGFRTRSMITVPVKDRGGVIFSVLQVHSKRGIPFDRSDEEFLQALAGQLGIVLETTSLYPQILGGTVRGDIELKNRFNNIIGDSESMKSLFEKIARIAGTDATVLLRGESGTGKELLARALHCNSPRAARPFVTIDCAALPESLIENELFGHARGAYTGATGSYDGRFLKAEGGTVFIDEIGELPLSLQPKLLRVLQEREFEPLGGSKTIRVDVRLITATNRNLEEMVARGHFREDLYYRVKVVQLDVPPLRERGEGDILALAGHSLHQLSLKHGRRNMALSEESRKAIAAYGWPGNVRELQGCMESALLMTEGNVIRPSSLNLPRRQADAGRSKGGGPAFDAPEDLTLDELEARYIRHLLAKHGSNRTKVARILGIGRNTLIRKIGREPV